MGKGRMMNAEVRMEEQTGSPILHSAFSILHLCYAVRLTSPASRSILPSYSHSAGQTT
jgi:hypothetical protein